MKSYKTLAVASFIAAKATKTNQTLHIAKEIDGIFWVGTKKEFKALIVTPEIDALAAIVAADAAALQIEADRIAEEEAAKATALFASQQAAADAAASAPKELDVSVKAVTITGLFHRQTNEMVAIFMKGTDRSPSWFKRKDLLSLFAIDDTLVLTVPDGFKHSGKTYKAA